MLVLIAVTESYQVAEVPADDGGKIRVVLLWTE